MLGRLSHHMAPGRRVAEARLLAKEVVAQAQRHGRKACLQKIYKNSGSGLQKWLALGGFLVVLVSRHWGSKIVRLNVPPNIQQSQ